MKVMPTIPGQPSLPASYARSIERPAESFCRMLSAELTAGQAHQQDLQQPVLAQPRGTDIFAQIEESHRRNTTSLSFSEQESQDVSEERKANTVRSSVDVAAVLDFMQDVSHIRNVRKAEKDATVKLLGDKAEVIAGIRQKNTPAWDRHHMSSAGNKQDVGVFIGFRIAIG
ncbi:MAG TPA: hypothetical protein VLH56_00550 [Dissulfurispiraceae bacterium]|nr:hypothetical protein [Dissulfurispiraceae bacterium]